MLWYLDQKPKTSTDMQILFRVLNHHSQQNLKDLVLGSDDCFSNISNLKTEFACVLIFSVEDDIVTKIFETLFLSLYLNNIEIYVFLKSNAIYVFFWMFYFLYHCTSLAYFFFFDFPCISYIKFKHSIAEISYD